MLLVYKLFILCLTGWAMSDSTSCKTANDEEGECVNINDCVFMKQKLIIAKANKSSEAAQYIKGSVCSKNGKDTLICCPVNNIDSKKDLLDSLLSPPHCGQADREDSRIVGGKPAKLGAWPWMAILGYVQAHSLRRKSGDKKVDWMCGGALISDRYVLTAAHCTGIPGMPMYVVRLGELDLYNDTDGANPIDVLVDKVIKYNKRPKKRYEDDIALVKLKEKVEFTKMIHPICLPKTEYLMTSDYSNLMPWVAGWGTTQHGGSQSSMLMELQMPMVDHNVCGKVFRRHRVNIADKQICAGFLAGGKDTCQGDSGGPLMVPQGPDFYVIGCVSFGYKCAKIGYPGVYCRVSHYLEWIAETIKN